MGVAILSEWIAGPHVGQGDLVAKRLASGPIERPWRLVWRREHDRTAPRLIAALRATVPHARLAG
jgi:LysR family transcriptional regulator for metE and metH